MTTTEETREQESRRLTAARSVTGSGYTVRAPRQEYGRATQTYKSITGRQTPQCQADGRFGIGQCENTGKPEQVVYDLRSDWHSDTNGWVAADGRDWAVTLHFCGTHSPTRKWRETTATRIRHDYEFARSEWNRRLAAVTRAHDERIRKAEQRVLEAARIDSIDPPAAALYLVKAAEFLRAEVRAANIAADEQRKVIEAEEPVRPEGV